MDACKCIVPSWHGGTLNSHRAASHLVRWVEGEERRETPGHLEGVLAQNWGGNEPNHTVTFMVLKLRVTSGVQSSPCHDEFRGPRSDSVRRVALATGSLF
ncbi:uncharacterized protein TNCV_731341 [Trichonephila clavipes]|nr:uncharacterized protein TNCV_731341 [Trichonephila clavipes]